MGDHHHHHDHPHPGDGRAFAVSVTLNVGFVVVEVVYGLLSGSMALVADAAHNLGDVLGLALAWGATRLARLDTDDRRTYGYRKSTVVAALLNAVLILVAVGGVAWEAVGRLAKPVAVDGWTVIVVAAIGVVINSVSAAMFFRNRQHDLNVRGAFLHLAADAAVSVGVVVAGVVVLTTGWVWVDPATSLAIAAVIVVGTWGLLRESVDMLMDAVPSHLELSDVRECVCGIDGVAEIHDLHVWPMSTNETCLTAHVGVDEDGDSATILSEIHARLKERFGITHVTVQLEPHHVAAGCEQGRHGRL
jgi:cobalt-zinc-cadmium efflux system protein